MSYIDPCVLEDPFRLLNRANASPSLLCPFSQSLLVSTLSHLLENVLHHYLDVDRHNPHRILRYLLENILVRFNQLGIVSQRFHDAFHTAIQFLLETTTFPAVSKLQGTKDISLLSSVTSFFGAKIQSIFLIADSSTNIDDIPTDSTCISGLSLKLTQPIQFSFKTVVPLQRFDFCLDMTTPSTSLVQSLLITQLLNYI
ncbi:hypothetical protein GEMRC1_007488 [Eukaryota sp. GEM-RC1]